MYGKKGNSLVGKEDREEEHTQNFLVTASDESVNFLRSIQLFA